MPCADVRRLLPAHAIAACDPDEAEQVTSHLSRRGGCRATWAEALAVAGALAYLPDPLPVPERVGAAVRRASRPTRAPRRRRPRRLAGWGALAAAALVGIGLGLGHLGQAPRIGDRWARAAARPNAQVAATVAAAFATGAEVDSLVGSHGMGGQVMLVPRMRLALVIAVRLPSGWYRLWLYQRHGWHRMDRFAADRGTQSLVAVALAGRPSRLAVTSAPGRPTRPMLQARLTAT